MNVHYQDYLMQWRLWLYFLTREQKKDSHLKEAMKKSEKFSEIIIERSTVITYVCKIYIPHSLRKRIVWWYHTYLQHPGIRRMEGTLSQNLVWSNLKKDMESAVKSCKEYQIGKNVRNKYGEIPEKLAERPITWNRIDVELIGPLAIKTPSGNTVF
jgi:hypothetical protein